jgi:hypothetical protein
MMSRMGANEFFEEDENVEDLLAEFDQAEERGKTGPSSGQTEYLTLEIVATGKRPTTQKSANNAKLFTG